MTEDVKYLRILVEQLRTENEEMRQQIIDTLQLVKKIQEELNED